MPALRTEEITLNMGPQHPSTHGVIRFVLKTDGEIIYDCEPDVGYLHRAIEKINEKVEWQGFVPYTDRIDYLAGMNANWAYCSAVEKLAGIEVPPRAEYIRVIICELNRIISHLLINGALAMDIGAATPFVQAIRDREIANDLIEEVCGARLTYSYIHVGGTLYDLPPGWTDKVLRYLDYLEPRFHQFINLIAFNEIFVRRLAGLAPTDTETAIDFGLVGPNLRASGFRFDLRRDEPYSVYPEFQFHVPTGNDTLARPNSPAAERPAECVDGDCYTRFWVRLIEVFESIKIIRQAIAGLPAGDHKAKMKKVLKAPAGEVYVRTEAPRGEMGFYIISEDKSPTSYRTKIRTGSFSAMGIFSYLAKGLMIADLVALIASLDIIAPEIDR